MLAIPGLLVFSLKTEQRQQQGRSKSQESLQHFSIQNHARFSLSKARVVTKTALAALKYIYCKYLQFQRNTSRTPPLCVCGTH